MTIDELKRLAHGRWPEILAAVGGIDPAILDGRHHPCPRCGGTDRFRCVAPDTGAVFCNQCFTRRNGDGIQAIGWLCQLSLPQTISKLAEYLGAGPPAGTPATGPSPAPGERRTHPTMTDAVAALDRRFGQRHANLWTYADADGRALRATVRWNKPDGSKEIRPIHSTADGWVIGEMPGPRPLYGLPALADAKVVYVVEGEKAADAARSIGLTATTSAGGAKSPDKTDWGPLAGKQIVILPDADEAGRDYAAAVAEILRALDPPATVRVVELPELPVKGDLVDWLDVHDAVEPDVLRERIEELAAAAPEWTSEAAKPPAERDAAVPLPPIVSASTIVATFPRLRTPVIHGLLREGETANVVAAPKAGKSWLAIGLALSVASGSKWLDTFDCEPGRVLLIDGELHPETIAHRLPLVAEAAGVPDCLDAIDVWPLRGQSADLFALGPRLADIEPGLYRLIVLDAWYRFLPPKLSENDNAAVMSLYNLIDNYAGRLGSAWVNVHHASKGDQSTKGVTDVGSGAGSQSRAADVHIVIRPHEKDGVAVAESVVRSWPATEPMAIRFDFPIWSLDRTADPNRLGSTTIRARRESREADQRELVRVAMEVGPAVKTKLRHLLGWGSDRFGRAFDPLEDNGTFEQIVGAGDQGQKRILWVVRQDGEL